jgi:hypothetical protein
VIVHTTLGPMDDSALVKKETDGVIEYYHNGALVHRSVEVRLVGLAGAGIAKI